MYSTSTSADKSPAPRTSSSGAKARGVAHCARCHANFSADSNTLGSCVIPHVFDASQAFDFGDGQCYYPSQCCGDDEIVVQDASASKSSASTKQGAREDDVANAAAEAKAKEEDKALFRIANVGPCFRGRHTTKEEDIEMQYNGWNIFRCVGDEKGRCMRAHLVQSDKKPVFSSGVIYTTVDVEDREWA